MSICQSAVDPEAWNTGGEGQQGILRFPTKERPWGEKRVPSCLCLHLPGEFKEESSLWTLI